MHELFRGFGPLFARQSVTWTVFLQIDLAVKKAIRKHYNYGEKQQIPLRQLLPASIIITLFNTTLVLPFDCVKTHMEKRDPTSTYLQTFGNIYREAGVITFFTGYRIRFMMYLLNIVFATVLMEKFESVASFLRANK
jgi:hypothetical protein